jgi:hypothetical protein
MAALLTRFAVGFAEPRREIVPQAAVDNVSNPIGNAALTNRDEGGDDHGAESSATFTTTSSNDDVSKDYQTMVAEMEEHFMYMRSCFASALFVVFWLVSRVTVLRFLYFTLSFSNMWIKQYKSYRLARRYSLKPKAGHMAHLYISVRLSYLPDVIMV